MPLASKQVRAVNENLRTYDTSAGDSTFQAVGAVLTNVPRLVKFKNDSNRDVTISYDGVNAHDIILAGDREVEDLTTNKTIESGFGRSKGTQIYARSTSGTGNFYITVITSES